MAQKQKRRVVKRTNFQGLALDIEFRRGDKRPYQDDAGRPREKLMHADYGEVRGTEGLDGDAVDVYVGPKADASKAFVVTQMKRGDWSKVDEEKCILGVETVAEARKLYLSHYDDPRFCGAIKEIPMGQFIERLATRGTVGKKIAATGSRLAELNYLRMQEGDRVLTGAELGIKTAIDSRIQHVLAKVRGKIAADEHIDPTWDDDMRPEVKRLLKRQDPAALQERRRNALGETEVTEMEQEGLGLPARKVAPDPTDSKLRKAAEDLKVTRFIQKMKIASADSSRAGRISDRLDDVGIGLLAAPYAAKGVAGALEHRPGALGLAGRAARSAANTMHHHENKMELAGLALVAPGVTHRLANTIDKRLPEKNASALDAAKGVVRGAARVGAMGTMVAAGGVGAGVMGAKKALTYHPHQGLHTSSYQPPRIL